jgi:hypothetical protein
VVNKIVIAVNEKLYDKVKSIEVDSRLKQSVREVELKTGVETSKHPTKIPDQGQLLMQFTDYVLKQFHNLEKLTITKLSNHLVEHIADLGPKVIFQLGEKDQANILFQSPVVYLIKDYSVYRLKCAELGLNSLTSLHVNPDILLCPIDTLSYIKNGVLTKVTNPLLKVDIPTHLIQTPQSHLQISNHNINSINYPVNPLHPPLHNLNLQNLLK